MYSYECQSALKTGRERREGKIIKIKIKFHLRHNLAKTLFGVWLYLVRRYCTVVYVVAILYNDIIYVACVFLVKYTMLNIV